MAKNQLTRLEHYAADIARVQRQIKSNVQRGLKSTDDRVQRFCVIRGRELLQELASLTWDSTAVLMQQEQKLYGPLTQQLPGWSPPQYFSHLGLKQWAKVRATPAGTFVFEALSSDHQGVLLELPEFRFREQWQPSTATEYRAILKHLLDTGAIAWNQLAEPVLANGERRLYADQPTEVPGQHDSPKAHV